MPEFRLMVISAAPVTRECYGVLIPQEHVKLSLLEKCWFSWNIACLLAHRWSLQQSENTKYI
jgi:hypothetical protein